MIEISLNKKFKIVKPSTQPPNHEIKDCSLCSYRVENQIKMAQDNDRQQKTGKEN